MQGGHITQWSTVVEFHCIFEVNFDYLMILYLIVHININIILIDDNIFRPVSRLHFFIQYLMD